MAQHLSKLVDSIVSDFDVAITTGYAGYLASDLLYSATNYIPAVNETVAVDFAHMYSYLGKRSLIVMKNAGLNEAFLPIVNSCVLGTNAGMVFWITDDLAVKGSEMAQDSTSLIRLMGIKPLKPKNLNQLYFLTRKAFIASEKRNIPQVILIKESLFDSNFSCERKALKNASVESKELKVLHMKTAQFFIDSYSKRRQTRTPLLPRVKTEGPISKFSSDIYKDLFTEIDQAQFDIVIGDFGTYTLAPDSPVRYGLHYGASIASGMAASLIGKKVVVLVGEGGLTSGFESIFELLRKKVDFKIILIENGGISKTENVGVDLGNLFGQLGTEREIFNSKDLNGLSKKLQEVGLKVFVVRFEL